MSGEPVSPAKDSAETAQLLIDNYARQLYDMRSKYFAEEQAAATSTEIAIAQRRELDEREKLIMTEAHQAIHARKAAQALRDAAFRHESTLEQHAHSLEGHVVGLREELSIMEARCMSEVTQAQIASAEVSRDAEHNKDLLVGEAREEFAALQRQLARAEQQQVTSRIQHDETTAAFGAKSSDVDMNLPTGGTQLQLDQAVRDRAHFQAKADAAAQLVEGLRIQCENTNVAAQKYAADIQAQANAQLHEASVHIQREQNEALRLRSQILGQESRLSEMEVKAGEYVHQIQTNLRKSHPKWDDARIQYFMQNPISSPYHSLPGSEPGTPGAVGAGGEPPRQPTGSGINFVYDGTPPIQPSRLPTRALGSDAASHHSLAPTVDLCDALGASRGTVIGVASPI